LIPGTRFSKEEKDEPVKTLSVGRRRDRAGEAEIAGPAPEDRTGHVAEAE
jgi:hypothetical protein